MLVLAFQKLSKKTKKVTNFSSFFCIYFVIFYVPLYSHSQIWYHTYSRVYNTVFQSKKNQIFIVINFFYEFSKFAAGLGKEKILKVVYFSPGCANHHLCKSYELTFRQCEKRKVHVKYSIHLGPFNSNVSQTYIHRLDICCIVIGEKGHVSRWYTLYSKIMYNNFTSFYIDQSTIFVILLLPAPVQSTQNNSNT